MLRTSLERGSLQLIFDAILVHFPEGCTSREVHLELRASPCHLRLHRCAAASTTSAFRRSSKSNTTGKNMATGCHSSIVRAFPSAEVFCVPFRIKRLLLRSDGSARGLEILHVGEQLLRAAQRRCRAKTSGSSISFGATDCSGKGKGIAAQHLLESDLVRQRDANFAVRQNRGEIHEHLRVVTNRRRQRPSLETLSKLAKVPRARIPDRVFSRAVVSDCVSSVTQLTVDDQHARPGRVDACHALQLPRLVVLHRSAHDVLHGLALNQYIENRPGCRVLPNKVAYWYCFNFARDVLRRNSTGVGLDPVPQLAWHGVVNALALVDHERELSSARRCRTCQHSATERWSPVVALAVAESYYWLLFDSC
mmetsp:Transcript_16407/g.40530  ORF Transcript_16407/g.40530 Transcript_16407/m.40530 type:complete len:365 (-) Transcript_16407:1629-2723(-)